MEEDGFKKIFSMIKFSPIDKTPYILGYDGEPTKIGVLY